ncbi:Serpentine Receptor, class Z [Caenorhabditis elegans]|uniref:Serpentine Receptor, class Z n=1 Tax=Caenorhabditis elegans TaxID=6239 RepID=O62051_CAEEL|nr:Serpentine Receptor, class Z [Caenorhabditis elegans]CAB05676.2 Serpentine Receptor, class Z [Caenorhabditis elegans]|eukprot:NP_502634.2 Serpentine Receptor, class Z [Caenorhabditis elegans]
MNVTETFEYSENLNVLKNGLLLIFLVIFLIIVICFLTIFPFYVYVNKKNQNSDKTALLFPMTNHFYEMIRKTYFIFVYFFGALISMPMLEGSNYATGSLIFLIGSYFALYIIVQVFHLLIFLLALQRFLLYYYPSTGKHVKSVQMIIFKKIKYIYAVFAMKEVICLCIFVVCNSIGCSGRKKLLAEMVYFSTFSVLNLLILIASFLYLPITISIHKLSRLSTNQERNKPQKYILWQTIFIFLSKAVFIPAFIVLALPSTDFVNSLVLMVVTDVLVVPLIIQISYLCCNKRNLTVLLSSFKCFNILNEIKKRRTVSTVQPN